MAVKMNWVTHSQNGKVPPGSRRQDNRRNNHRFLRLGASLLLCLVVFAGRGLFPARWESLRSSLQALLGQTTTLQDAWDTLNQGLQEGRSALAAVGDWCIEVFAPSDGEQEESVGNDTGETSETEVASDSDRKAGSGTVTEDKADALPAALPEGTPIAAVGQAAFLSPLPCAPLIFARLSHVTRPLSSGTITSAYGSRTLSGHEGWHSGLDIAADEETIIYAFADGTVTAAAYSADYGAYLEIDHGGGITTRYAHCSILRVTAGTSLSGGQAVATVGDTGNATGPHLHFELRVDGKTTDPLSALVLLT